MSNDTLKIINSEKAKTYIAQKKREDGRDFLDHRPIDVKVNVINSADGSAWVKIGNTEIIAGIKFGMSEPYPDSPNQGSMVFNLEITNIASPDVETGPPSIEAMEFGRIADRVIRSAEFVDFEKLCVVPGQKVLTVFVDCYAINADGNLIDAAQFAALSAILNCKMPKLDENNNIIYKEYTDQLLPVNKENLPLSFTFYKVDGQLLLDATDGEEYAANARFTLGICNDVVVAYHKGGDSGTFTVDEINNMMDVASSKYNEIKKKLL